MDTRATCAALALLPPFRFSTVEAFVYRGAYPTLRNFRFLRRLQLRTIISLIPEPPTSDLVEFCHKEQIQHIHFEVKKFTDTVTIAQETVAAILPILLTPAASPVYLHCLDGCNVTGIVIMILRKLQHWNRKKILAEFCRFTRNRAIEKEEVEYLQHFHHDLAIPSPVVEWLWNGVEVRKHPTLRLPLPVRPTRDLPENPQTGASSSLDRQFQEFDAIIRAQQEDPRDTRASRVLESLDLVGI